MFKKILLSSVILFASSSIASASSVYMGLTAGADLAGNWHVKTDSGNKKTLTGTGPQGGLFFGVGGDLDSGMYLGVEGFANEGDIHSGTKTIVTSQGPSSARLRLKYSFGVSLIPGFNFNNAYMLFGRLGIVRSRFDFHLVPPASGATSNLDTERANGAQIGVGLRVNFNQIWGARLEYDYSRYNQFTSFNQKINVRDSQVNLGVIYNFE